MIVTECSKDVCSLPWLNKYNVMAVKLKTEDIKTVETSSHRG